MNLKKIVSSILGLPKSSFFEREISPGFIEERRVFLWKPAVAVAGLAFAGVTRVWAQDTGSKSSQVTDDLDFDSFYKECAMLVKEAAANVNLNEEEHVFKVSSLAARLRLREVPKAKMGPFAGLNPPVDFGPIKIANPLSLIQWRLAPGAILPAHNHNPADVVSVCIEGEALVRHFDLDGPAPDYSTKQTFHIRETRSDLLTPGRMSSLTQKRDNIHTFLGGKEGALGMDINTFLPGDKPFSFLDFSPKPIDQERRIYEAVWKKIPNT